MAHGVARTIGYGFPDLIKQADKKNALRADALKGTTQVARLNLNYLDVYPNLKALSVYNTKSVHLMSDAVENVEWIVKKKRLWDSLVQDMRMIGFLWLNMIYEYNNNMNSVGTLDEGYICNVHLSRVP
jgi:hypothetical protein